VPLRPTPWRRAEATAAQVSVQADVLRECFGEILGVAGAARVKMRVSNRAPYFRLSTAGTSGSCSVDLPRGSDAVTAHTVTPKGAGQDDGEAAGELSVTSEFLAPLIEQAVRPLASSSTAFLRINHDVRGRAASPRARQGERRRQPAKCALPPSSPVCRRRAC